MAVTYRLLLALGVVLQLAAFFPAQGNAFPFGESSNSSFIKSIFPSFESHPFLNIKKWLAGISSIFPTPVLPKITNINGTNIWSVEIDIAGFNSSDMNVTRRGLALEVLGKQINAQNQTREMLYQQMIPSSAELNKLQAVMKDHKLIITVPLKIEETVIIPIKVDSNLKFKPTVKAT